MYSPQLEFGRRFSKGRRERRDSHPDLVRQGNGPHVHAKLGHDLVQVFNGDGTAQGVKA